ncbi:hypothetical protein DO97_09880 [Neosynechococcus sphagnicola sy1]|uniref:GerMN domain-containing protein n=1 Tax=Neosynechococcus sphagnicola sy1 TaxID=1497020 RepID=A0A098TN35_9CYAN|nr:GerMN domain-containing protein [Neosynechococcus sphagnicola]KGF73740.1 hypothetical protein DO97_09880 [Neosynechococcus sphagnicola sy1]
MQEPKPVGGVPRNVLVGFAALILVVGGGTAWYTWGHLPGTPPPLRSLRTSLKQSVSVYWLKHAGNKTELVPGEIAPESKAKSNDAALETAFERLLAGPAEDNLTTTIPPGTQLRGVRLEADGIHVDLSREFTAGGGSESMTGRLGQIVYTATSLQPSAPVWVAVEGKLLDVLGGEGLIVDQPLTRQSFKKDFDL